MLIGAWRSPQRPHGDHDAAHRGQRRRSLVTDAGRSHATPSCGSAPAEGRVRAADRPIVDVLIRTAAPRPVLPARTGETANPATGGAYPYQSGWITTAGKFTLTHGMIDFKARMPTGQGLWSGLWTVNAHGSTPQGEIDVQEMLLGDTHTVNGSLHGWSPAPLWGETQFVTTAAGMLTWALDGVAYAQYTVQQAQASGRPWPFDTATGVYLIANLAVGGADEWGGAPTAQTTFAATMQVQSVKVWQ